MTDDAGPPSALDLKVDQQPHETFGEHRMSAQDATTSFVYVIEASGKAGALGVYADAWDAIEAARTHPDLQDVTPRYTSNDNYPGGVVAEFSYGAQGQLIVRRVPVTPAGHGGRAKP